MNKLGSSRVPDAVYQVSMKSANQIQRRFLQVFTIYRYGGYLGHVTRIIWTNFFPNPKEDLHEIWLIDPVISEMFEVS